MSSRALLVASVAASALLATSRADAIVSGHDGGDPAVVALEDNGEVVCSGVLVGPRTVLTAAHCMRHTSDLRILSGGRAIAMQSVRSHPGFDAKSLTDDLAVIRLGEDATGPFAALPQTKLGASLTTVTVVGFGLTTPTAKSSGAKREGTAAVSRLGDRLFEVTPAPAITCRGDSGGAAFAEIDGERMLVGIVSSGDLFCAKRATITRVDDDDDELLRSLRPRGGSSTSPLGLGIAAVLVTLVAYAARRTRASSRTPRSGACRRSACPRRLGAEERADDDASRSDRW